jgi:hypothetical protein
MPQLDCTKLLKLISELNDNYSHGNAYTAHVLLRAILDHIPPMFGYKNFTAVVNNYPWSQTDKAYMRKLLDSGSRQMTSCTGRSRISPICSA